MAVPGATIRREAADDHIRLEFADQVYHVSQDLLLIPDGKCFLRVFGEAEVLRAGEELFRAVNAAGRQQLLGADEPQQLRLLVAHEVLPAVAAGKRKVAGPVQLPFCQEAQQAGIFVVGMSGNI